MLGCGLEGLVEVFSPYFGMVQQLGPLEAGARLLLVPVAAIVAGAPAGRLMHRVPARWMITVGLLLAGALLAMTNLDADISYGSIAWRLLLDREVDRTPQLSCLRAEDLIEARLPQVLECVVLAESGRDPLPVVVTADGALDQDRWKEAVRDLPPLREPVALTWDQVPRTGTGKVRRRELLHRLTGRTGTYGSGRWT